MQNEFNIKLDVFEGIPTSVPDKSVKKVKNVTEALDPLALTCLFQMCQSTRSSAVGLCILHDKISIEEGVRAARVDEDHQTAKFGVVEGAHDLDEAYLYTTLSSAKNVVNLALLRE
jgi:ATP synthase F1 complex assembly factor 2